MSHEDPVVRSLLTRTMALGQIVEALATIVVAQNPELKAPMFAMLRGAAASPGPAGNMPDEAAEFAADVRVISQGSLEKMLERIEAQLMRMHQG